MSEFQLINYLTNIQCNFILLLSFRAQKGEEELLKLLFGLAVIEAVEEQRQKEQELMAKLAVLSILASATQRNILQLRSCCSSQCPCKRKQKTRIDWKHYCGEPVYLTNFGKIWCKKCDIDKEAQFWKLYCLNGTADDYNYQTNSVENCLFVCAESLKEVQNKEVASKFLQEFTSAVKKNVGKK